MTFDQRHDNFALFRRKTRHILTHLHPPTTVD
ncbi:Uncharacterised protein [Vibrio cholerae]|nr:Uncharacterised protein [Vibrio cholerae]CSI71754.1 Uncharacterised protein [Vibrio cholerae]